MKDGTLVFDRLPHLSLRYLGYSEYNRQTLSLKQSATRRKGQVFPRRATRRSRRPTRRHRPSRRPLLPTRRRPREKRGAWRRHAKPLEPKRVENKCVVGESLVHISRHCRRDDASAESHARAREPRGGVALGSPRVEADGLHHQ